MNCKFCTGKVVAREMCSTHYQRWKRTGNPEIAQQGKRTDAKPIEQRMTEHHIVLDNGCHEWTAGINQYGYGKVKYQYRTIGAHVMSWFLATGNWPEEELDHLCHTLDPDCVGGVECRHRRCINPNHLEPVGNKENTRRRDIRIGLDQGSRTQKEIKRKHLNVCGNGHEYTEENTRITPKGHRSCRTCAREYARERRRR